MDASIFCETLRLLIYFTLLLTLFYRITPWIKAESGLLGYFLRTVSETLCMPLRRLLKRLTDRYPTAVDIPAMLLSVLLTVLGGILPRL